MERAHIDIASYTGLGIDMYAPNRFHCFPYAIVPFSIEHFIFVLLKRELCPCREALPAASRRECSRPFQCWASVPCFRLYICRRRHHGVYKFHLPWERFQNPIPSHLICIRIRANPPPTIITPNRTSPRLIYHVLVERPSSSTTPTPTTSTQPSQLRITFLQLPGHQLSRQMRMAILHGSFGRHTEPIRTLQLPEADLAQGPTRSADDGARSRGRRCIICSALRVNCLFAMMVRAVLSEGGDLGRRRWM